VRGNSHARFCSRGVRGDPRIDCNRLAFGLARRAQELTKAKQTDTNGPVDAVPQPTHQPSRTLQRCPSQRRRCQSR
jgi:hypothetical protein